MKVKVGNKVYDSNREPIMLVLSEDDKKNIKGMTKDSTKFCAFPAGTQGTVIKNFMKIAEEPETTVVE
jgi:hypothetical protein